MKAIPPHSHAAPRVDRLARRREPQPSPEGALHGGHTGTPWSEITASRRSEERLWKLVFIYRYRLFCTRCTVGRWPVLRVRPDASTGSGQGVHGVSKDWVEVLKPGHPPVRAEPVEAFGLNQAPGSLVRSGAALSPRRATHFLLLRQKKVSQEKATLLSASLRCAAGNLRCSVQPGSRADSPAAQTSTSPDSSGPPLLGAYRRGGSGIREL